MKNYKINTLYAICAAIVLFFVVVSCSVNKAFEVGTPEVNAMADRGYLTDVKELKKGYSAYVTRCGSCHHLIEPSKYTVSEWQANYLTPEFTKAKVEDGSEKKLISYFIFSKAK